jgi:hypothetical protein
VNGASNHGETKPETEKSEPRPPASQRKGSQSKAKEDKDLADCRALFARGNPTALLEAFDRER